MLLLLLLLSSAAAANRGGRRKEATPAPTASDPRVRRADALNRWFATIEHLPARARPLEGWTVSHRRDIPGRTRLGSRGNAKQVLRGTYRNRSVIVKGSSANHTRDKLGDAVHLELVFLESLRGAPGVPDGPPRSGRQLATSSGVASAPAKSRSSTTSTPDRMDHPNRRSEASKAPVGPATTLQADLAEANLAVALENASWSWSAGNHACHHAVAHIFNGSVWAWKAGSRVPLGPSRFSRTMSKHLPAACGEAAPARRR